MPAPYNRPAIIASMQFFNCPAETSHTPQNEGTKAITEFFDAHGRKVGYSRTKRGYTTYTTDYFDPNENLIGRSESDWKGSMITTKYFIGDSLVGTSKTFWGGTLHMTNYFNLENTIVNFSRTKKEGSKSNTNYNLPIPTESAMLSEYTKAPREFFISPLLENGTVEPAAEKISQFSSSSPTMHRAQPENIRENHEVEASKNEGKCCIII